MAIIVTGGETRSSLDNAARKMILGSLDRFIRDRLAPRAKEIDATAEFPRDLYKAVGELGIFGLWVPAEFGGSGPDLVTPLLVAERLARVSVAFALSVSNMGDCMVPLATAGSDWAKQAYLPGMAQGDIVPCFCLSEPSGGSDVAAMKAHARRDGRDYRLTGRKMWITSAPVSDVAIVFVRTDPDAGHKGITGFIVPRNAKGLTVGKPEELVGLRGSPTAEVVFEDVRVPAEARLGQEGEGFRLAMVTLDESRLNVAAISLGAATAALAEAVEYARVRVQFGKSIIEHQGLQFILSDRAAELAATRALWEKSVAVMACGPSRLASTYASMSKLMASDLAMRAAIDAVQVLGAYGLSKSYPVERLLRDCKALQIFEGSNEIQRWSIGRQLQRSGLVLEELDRILDGEG
jgi:alkylation response protein AidB-like acyl-CoA dehydrogenase